MKDEDARPRLMVYAMFFAFNAIGCGKGVHNLYTNNTDGNIGIFVALTAFNFAILIETIIQILRSKK